MDYKGSRVSHPYFMFFAALVAVFPSALLLLLQLYRLEGPQQLLFPQFVTMVPGSEALQQLQHFHYSRHQTHDAVIAIAINQLLYLGPDQFGYFIHVVHVQRRECLYKAALRVFVVGMCLHVCSLHMLLISYRNRHESTRHVREL